MRLIILMLFIAFSKFSSACNKCKRVSYLFDKETEFISNPFGIGNPKLYKFNFNIDSVFNSKQFVNCLLGKNTSNVITKLNADSLSYNYINNNTIVIYYVTDFPKYITSIFPIYFSFINDRLVDIQILKVSNFIGNDKGSRNLNLNKGIYQKKNKEQIQIGGERISNCPILLNDSLILIGNKNGMPIYDTIRKK